MSGKSAADSCVLVVCAHQPFSASLFFFSKTKNALVHVLLCKHGRLIVQSLYASPIKVSLVLVDRPAPRLYACQSKSVWSLVRGLIRMQSRLFGNAAAIAHSLSISFHISQCLAALIHVSPFFISFSFVTSVSSGLRKSLISSSGLPTGLGFHSAAFFAHRSSGSDAILIADRHFILQCVSIQHGIWAASSFQLQKPCFFSCIHQFFLFNFCCVNFFIGIIHEGDVASTWWTTTI